MATTGEGAFIECTVEHGQIPYLLSQRQLWVRDAGRKPRPITKARNQRHGDFGTMTIITIDTGDGERTLHLSGFSPILYVQVDAA